MEMKIPQHGFSKGKIKKIVMKSGIAIEKKQNLLAPKNFIKFAENYALLY